MKSLLLLWLLWVCYPAIAAIQILDGMVPGMGSYAKEIQSIRERKFEHIVRQHTDFSCGAASLATILKYAYGQSVTEEQVMHGMLAHADMKLVAEKGFSLLDMKTYLQQMNYRGRGYRIGLDELTQLRVPVILLINDQGYNHFVVFRKIWAGEIYLADPVLGNRILPIETFLSQWNDIVFVVIGKDYDKQTPLLSPRGRLTHKVSMVIEPMSDAELIEYGFSYSDLL
ncbi:C39 family peptidase [Shewanella sp. NIFS-20-20]|nr:C39 family peptidase [Shewanella sp. NIFS-20-20]